MTAKYGISFHSTDGGDSSGRSCDIAQFIDKDPEDTANQRAKKSADESGRKTALFSLNFLLVCLQGRVNFIFTGITEKVVAAIDFVAVNLLHISAAFGTSGSKSIADQIINDRVNNTVDGVRYIFTERRYLNSKYDAVGTSYSGKKFFLI